MTSNKIKEYINVAYKKYGMIQNPLEIESFVEFLNNINCKNVLKIGNSNDGVFYILNNFSNTDGIKIAIDINKPESDSYNFTKNTFIIKKNSNEIDCINEIKKILNDELFDLIFIDDDYSYKNLKSNFDNYQNFLVDGGYIVFNNINHFSSKSNLSCEVYKFWKEIKSNYSNCIEYSKKSFGGIGIVQIFKNKKNIKINLEYQKPNIIHFTNYGESNLNTIISIRDRDTKIPIYFNEFTFEKNCPTYFILPLVNYDFNEDKNFSGFLVEFYDKDKKLIDSKDLLIKKNEQLIESYTLNYYAFDNLFINYKQFFYDKIYDPFIDDEIETVIDIGANVGLFSNYISWKKNVKIIHALEPVSKPFNELRKQFCRYNGVKCHKIAIHYNNGKSIINTNDSESILNTFLNTCKTNNLTEEVEIMTLPTFLNSNNIDSVDLIKLDVEGLEYEIIHSMNDRELMRSKRWLIEYHLNENNKTENLKNRFTRLGYQVTDVSECSGIQGFFFAKKI